MGHGADEGRGGGRAARRGRSAEAAVGAAAGAEFCFSSRARYESSDCCTAAEGEPRRESGAGGERRVKEIMSVM
eukprot:scaffold99350_cov19-Tisochrysis_lutea.AAC.1